MTYIKKHIKIVVFVVLYCLTTLGFSQIKLDSGAIKLNYSQIKDEKQKIQISDSIKNIKSTESAFNSNEKKALFNPQKNLKVIKDSVKLKNTKDTLKSKSINAIKLKRSDFSLHGLISNQLDYGLVPYYLPNASIPANLIKSQGDIKFSLKKLPLIFNYFYMNPANLLGLRNYYTLKFDFETYQNNLQKDYAEKKDGYLTKIKALEKQKQETEQKLAYCESIQNMSVEDRIKLKSLNNEIKTPNQNGIINDSLKKMTSVNPVSTIKDTTRFNIKNDSLLNLTENKPKASSPYTSSNIDSSQVTKNYGDSLNTKLQTDSNYIKIKDYKEKIGMYDKQLIEYEDAYKMFNETKNIGNFDNPYLSKMNNIMNNVKRFEIGMCYPNYSTFLISNLTLKGINAEYATSYYFINATYGKTLNNLLNVPQTNNSIINSFQQYSNFFDFNKNQDARKIISGKIGVGDKNRSYLAFGALYGVGKQSYLTSNNDNEKNVVYEIDGKAVVKGYTIYASFAKSSIKSNNTNNDQFGDPLQKRRNNGLQIKFSGVLPYIKTKFSLGYRLVDPFFKSYGVGFMRTDNIRYEAKFEQNISSKLKLSVSFRRDEDNVLKRFGFKSTLDYISYGAKIKLLKKRLDINLMYSPIVQNILNLSTEYRITNKSDMKNCVISYTPKFRKVVTTITAMYNQYSIYDSISLRNLENYNLNLTNIFKNSFKITASSSYFNSNVSDSSATPKTLLSILETGYTFKNNITTSLGVKHSYNTKTFSNQYGAMFNIGVPLNKMFFLELHAEKLIIGDFYNSINTNNINNFPYYFYGKVNIKF